MILVCGFLIAISIYLILDTFIVKKFIGIVLLGSSINLAIFICGHPMGKEPVFWAKVYDVFQMGNPLSQALILTAIVIGFALLAFLGIVMRILIGAHRDD